MLSVERMTVHIFQVITLPTFAPVQSSIRTTLIYVNDPISRVGCVWKTDFLYDVSELCSGRSASKLTLTQILRRSGLSQNQIFTGIF